MALWKKIVFCAVLVLFIGLSVFITFYSIARDTFEYRYSENIEDTGIDGWELFGFNGNTSTKEINIDFVRNKKGENPDPEKPVVAVGSFTVNSDEYIEYINIGESLEYISEDAFFYLKALKAVFVDENNPYFTSVNGVLYNKDMTELILHPAKNGDYLVENGLAETNDSFEIPESVETVRSYSFYKNFDLVHLTIHDNIKHIGDMAFFYCDHMWTIWLNEGLETIGNDAFSYCGSISPVLYIPKSVKSIGNYAFYSSTSIKFIYMGADSEDEIELGDRWEPKSIKKALFFVAPELEWGKTLEDAVAKKEYEDSLSV